MCLYFLAIGHLEVWIADEHLRQYMIQVLIPGSMFGEIGLICD
jgi:CRP-like cAMP-binding protein